jgi:hypothetical protein
VFYMETKKKQILLFTKAESKILFMDADISFCLLCCKHRFSMSWMEEQELYTLSARDMHINVYGCEHIQFFLSYFHNVAYSVVNEFSLMEANFLLDVE